MEKDFLADRRKALEESFFHEHDQQLLDTLRADAQRRVRKETLRLATGIGDEGVIDRLADLGFDAETLLPFALVPLVTIAWTDGRIDAAERATLLNEIESAGIARGSAAHRIFERWLESAPSPALFDAWEAYTRTLCKTLPAEDRAWLADALLRRARAVASASGGILGPGFRESKDELDVIARMERAFA